MRIALLPWGDVIEDYLDTAGVSLAAFRDEMTGGWLFGYVEALQSAGIDTTIFCASAGVDGVRHWTHRPTGAALCVLPGRRGVSPYRATPLRLLRRELLRYGCAAILCQEYEYARFDCCAALGLLMRIPVFATYQGGNYQRHFTERFVRPWSLRACSGLIIAPRQERERVQQKYGLHPERIAAIFNPVDPGLWYPEDRAQARAALGIPPEEQVAAWHGRIDIRNKGLDLLLEAWHMVGRGRLLLAGDGPDAETLRRRIGADPRIDWRDQYTLDRAWMRGFLSAADLYVFPSRHEGFAVAPLEAMACGLPVVATETSGLEGDESVIVVPPDDPLRVAQSIDYLLFDADRCRRLGKSARRHAEAAFSPSAVGARLRHFLTSSTRSRRSGSGDSVPLPLR
jgi:glycosyltransferase involved in cell wall biosynthesis